MNWLKSLTLSELRQRFGAFKLLIMIMVSPIILATCSFKLGNTYQAHQTQVISEQKQRLDNLYQLNEQAQTQINTLQVELELERLANQKAQQALRSVEDDRFSLRKELAFYEKIMAPEKSANGVIIDEVSVVATASENHYRYRVVLVQQRQSKRYAKGHIELTFNGSLQNRPASVTLSSISDIDKQHLSFSFQYFQVLEGEFTLPQGFVPEQIDVLAVLTSSKRQKLNQSYPWTTNT